MGNDNQDRWAMLPGPKWTTLLQARTWLTEQRRRLGWSHKDVDKAFFACAVKSDLYIGCGGGETFPRATEKRVARFEREGSAIPDWMYWMPLAIQYFEVPWESRVDWERENIPANSDLRQEEQEAEFIAHTPYLEGDELALLARYREMSADERDVLQVFSTPKILRWWMSCMLRANERGVDLVEAIDRAISREPAR